MQLSYKFINYTNNDELLEQCKICKDLYNQALYIFRTTLQSENRFISYNEMEKIIKNTPNIDGEYNYKLLIKAQVAQQCLKSLDKNIKSYIKSIKSWSKDKSKWNGKPKLPNYKKKNSLKCLTFTNQAAVIKNGNIFFTKTLSIPIPQWDKYRAVLQNGFNQISVHPNTNNTSTIIITYTVDDYLYKQDVEFNKTASIDLGVDNLVTLISSEFKPILYNGRQIKSHNQWFNKRLSKLKSILEIDNKTKTSKQTQQLWVNRNNYMNDIFHKISRHIVRLLLKHKIGKLIIGYNKGWKESIHLGKVTNQNFCGIPYMKLIEFLEYKCKLCGIKVICNEESYTSKCDGLGLESIEKHEKYIGKRVKRGLFQSSVGKLINADINGALNIMRKVVGDSSVMKIINSGWLFQPIKLYNIYELPKVTCII